MRSLFNWKSGRRAAVGVAGALLLNVAAFGGTVITAGLPANTALVNISGTADGASGYDSTQTYWYSPFNTSSTLLEYTIQPGTYNFRIVNSTDAAALYPSLTTTQLNSVYTAWTYNSPWVTDYLVFDSSAATNSSEYQLFAGAVTPSMYGLGFGSADDAYNTAKSDGYYDQIVAGVGGRYHGTTSTDYTFSSAETLIFAVPDYDVNDNGGGISVLITPASMPSTGTPEPASLLLVMAGLGAMPWLRRRIAQTRQ